MTKTISRTQWFVDCKPERSGIYERNYGFSHAHEVIIRCRFKGGVWYADLGGLVQSDCQNLPWRGLSQPADISGARKRGEG